MAVPATWGRVNGAGAAAGAPLCGSTMRVTLVGSAAPSQGRDSTAQPPSFFPCGRLRLLAAPWPRDGVRVCAPVVWRQCAILTRGTPHVSPSRCVWSVGSRAARGGVRLWVAPPVVQPGAPPVGRKPPSEGSPPHAEPLACPIGSARTGSGERVTPAAAVPVQGDRGRHIRARLAAFSTQAPVTWVLSSIGSPAGAGTWRAPRPGALGTPPGWSATSRCASPANRPSSLVESRTH